jgi:TRAP-type transport system small permease protein
MSPRRGVLAQVDHYLEVTLRWTCIVSMTALTILVCALVLVRFYPLVSLGWADEIVELAFAWMVFLGTALVWRNREHITIDFIPQALAGTVIGRVIDVAVSLLILWFMVVFTWQGWLLTLRAVGNTTPMLILPKPLWYAAIPVSGVLMIVYTIIGIVRPIRSAPPDPETIKI